MADNEIWVHGSSVVVEYPELLEDPALFRVNGFGALIQQPAGTRNWFHFPIPTPVAEGDGAPHLVGVHLSMQLSAAARIERVAVHEGANRIFHASVKWSDETIERSLPMRGRVVRGGLVVCLYAAFEGQRPQGEVVFRGVGARFEE